MWRSNKRYDITQKSMILLDLIKSIYDNVKINHKIYIYDESNYSIGEVYNPVIGKMYYRRIGPNLIVYVILDFNNHIKEFMIKMSFNINSNDIDLSDITIIKTKIFDLIDTKIELLDNDLSKNYSQNRLSIILADKTGELRKNYDIDLIYPDV